MSDDRWIFVFGSNLAGRHGKGAALEAKKNWGAVDGIGEGPMGFVGGLNPTCWAIATKDRSINSSRLSVIYSRIHGFLRDAWMYQHHDFDWKFKVTRIGCGLAGFSDQEIAPAFYHHPPNCHFDEAWKPWLPERTKFWGTYP